MRIEEIKKGDIITYRSGKINNVNKPSEYKKWYDENFTHIKWGEVCDIIKIQRYFKFLWFYRLKTIYKRVK